MRVFGGSSCIWINTVYTHTYMLHILCHFSESLNCIQVAIVATAATVVIHVEAADCDPCEVHCDRILMFY